MSHQTTLEGQTALVTGSARRIGAEIVRQLHGDGARVAIHHRSSVVDAERLRDELNAVRPDSAEIFAADLLETETLQDLVEAVVGWSGHLDILINNASSFYPTPIGSVTESNWRDLVGSNLKAPLFLTQAAHPHLRARNGRVVNIVDIHARRPLSGHLVYGPAKAALEMLTKSLAKELAPEVRVNGVSPGAILWPEGGLSDADRDAILQQIPLARTGAPEDIAGCVLWLVRDATYVTGQVIAIDGGRSLGW
ncbi:MAG: pteridine reductase [Pseudomonadota bacterium]